MADRYETFILDNSAFDSWDRIVESAPQGTLFNTTEWYRILEEVTGQRWEITGCAKNGNLVGGCISHVTNRAGFNLLLPPLLTSYPGIILLPSESERVCDSTEERLKRVSLLERDLAGRYALAWMVHHEEMSELRPFVWNGWETIPRYTYLLNLSSPEELMAGLKPSLRNKVRKGEKHGFVLRRLNDLSSVASFYSSSYERHGGSPPVSSDTLTRWFSRLSAEGMAMCFSIEDAEGRPHAFRIVLLDGRNACDWVAGSDPSLFSEGGTPFLLWKVIEELTGSFDTYNLMGANTPTIASFKASFGGDLRIYWETRRFRSRLVRFLFDMRVRFR